MRVHSPRIAVVPTDSQQNLQPARYSCTVSRALYIRLAELAVNPTAPVPAPTLVDVYVHCKSSYW